MKKNKFAAIITLINLLIIGIYNGWVNNIMCLFLVGAIPGTSIAIPPALHLLFWVYMWLIFLFFKPTKKLVTRCLNNKKQIKINLLQPKYQKA